jgi:hypothetical protein
MMCHGNTDEMATRVFCQSILRRRHLDSWIGDLNSQYFFGKAYLKHVTITTCSCDKFTPPPQGDSSHFSSSENNASQG